MQIRVIALACLGGVACGGQLAADGSDASACHAGDDAGTAAWATGSCDGGCPSGTACVQEHHIKESVDVGCAPLPASCGGVATCSCLPCVCAARYTCGKFGAGILCDDGLVSRRSAKADIAYVRKRDRAALAREALAIRLARYRYKTEPRDARPRLGFLIDDQRADCPAVEHDGEHVDLYGLASMLLATVQSQAAELRALQRRVRALEGKSRR